MSGIEIAGTAVMVPVLNKNAWARNSTKLSKKRLVGRAQNDRITPLNTILDL